MAKATKSTGDTKSSGKRTTIEPNGDKRYIKRDEKGQIKESDDVGKSLSAAVAQVMPPFTSITFNPNIMGGKPCIRGMRVTVGTIVGLLASGHDIDKVLAAYPYLEREDIFEALAFAAWRVEEREIPMAAL